MTFFPWEIRPELANGQLSQGGVGRRFFWHASAERFRRKAEASRREASVHGYRWVIVDRRKDFSL